MDRELGKRLVLLVGFVAFIFAACNKDAVIEEKVSLKPTIEFDSENGVYVVKVGREFQINPCYKNADGANYSWVYDGKIISEEPSLRYRFDEPGEFIITLRVDTKNGGAEEELRVEVADLAPPVVSILSPLQGFYFLAGQEFFIRPDVQNKEGATYKWTLDGEEVGCDSVYTFVQHELRTYRLKLVVTNADGGGEKTITIKVVESLPANLILPFPSRFVKDSIRYVEAGRTLFLRAYLLMDAVDLTCQWSVDGKPVPGATEMVYGYTPSEIGESEVSLAISFKTPKTRSVLTRNVSATGETHATIKFKVRCQTAAPMRPYVAGNSLNSNKVYEFVPAPGQFINNTAKAGYSGESTHDAACEFAQRRLDECQYVSLGGFGGYIVVGFDHSIENRGGYDFSIKGNQFDGSSEPGIVWVMQDVNGNGMPDDEWYELKGSEYGKPETIQDYAVTYFRPAPFSDTPWQDNKGQMGCIDRLAEYHPQPFYYPLWIKEERYTLFGTCLKDRTTRNKVTKFWYNGAFGWGYADNLGDDMPSKDNHDANPIANRFKISHAVNGDGTPANLSHIDFIKVQNGVNVKAGWLGENSTEVFQFTDLNNQN